MKKYKVVDTNGNPVPAGTYETANNKFIEVDEDGMTAFNSLEKLENMKGENGKLWSVKHFNPNHLVVILNAEKNNEYKYVMPFGTRVAVVMLAAMAGGFVVMIIASLISLCK